MDDRVLSIENVSKDFFVDGKAISVMRNICLTVQKGEFITIVGHSGCGKSTLLKLVAGIVGDYEGTIIRSGRIVSGPGTDCGMVFQDHRLLPWLRVRENISFGIQRLPRAERDALVDYHLKLIHLDGFADAWPHQLSGGMSQRVAIARGLVTNPSVLLLDEPFGALDALTRIQLQREILRIWEKKKTTMLMVTHDIDEAIFLGERVVVMSARPGEIKEIITIPKGIGAERASPEFARYKNRIYNHFFANTQENV